MIQISGLVMYLDEDFIYDSQLVDYWKFLSDVEEIGYLWKLVGY